MSDIAQEIREAALRPRDRDWGATLPILGATIVLYVVALAIVGLREGSLEPLFHPWWWILHVAAGLLMLFAFLRTTTTVGDPEDSRVASRVAAAIVFALLIVAIFAVRANGTTGTGSEGDDGTTGGGNGGAPAAVTPVNPDSEFCPGGTSDDLRFELEELEHPQSLTPVWPQDYEEQTEFLFGPEGVACDNVQILYALATWLDDEDILGESDGDVQASSAKWIALLRENGERRLDILEAVYENWSELTLVEVAEDVRFDGDIYRLVPRNPDTIVWDQFDIAEDDEGLLVGDYTVFRGEGADVEHLLMSLQHGWALAEDVPLAADIEDHPELEEPSTGSSTTVVTEDEDGTTGVTQAPDGSQPEGDRTGDTTGPGDDEDGTTGEPGGGGECDDVNPTPDCDGTNPGGGGEGGDDEDKDCPGCPGEDNGGGEEPKPEPECPGHDECPEPEEPDEECKKCPPDTTSPPPTSPPTTQPPPKTTTTRAATTTTEEETTTLPPPTTVTTKHGGAEPTTTAPGGCQNPPCAAAMSDSPTTSLVIMGFTLLTVPTSLLGGIALSGAPILLLAWLVWWTWRRERQEDIDFG